MHPVECQDKASAEAIIIELMLGAVYHGEGVACRLELRDTLHIFALDMFDVGPCEVVTCGVDALDR